MRNFNKNKLELLDLSMVKMKLQDQEEGPGWSKEYANLIENKYKKFLFLIGTVGDAVPTKEIDKMWHQHILDTKAYANDCQDIFGEFIHHFPYLGMRGGNDKDLLVEKFNKTKIDYQTVFGADLAHCRGGNHNGCSGSTCSGAGCIGSCNSR